MEKDKEKEKEKDKEKEWEKGIREKINANRSMHNLLSEVDATDEKTWSLKTLLLRMTAIFSEATDTKRSNLIGMCVLGGLYIVGIIMAIADNQGLGMILMGAASAWKFFTWGDDVDRYNEQTGNVSYTARTNMFGEVKVEKNSGNVGCVMAIIGLVLGVFITPVLFIISLVKFIKSNKNYNLAKEIVEDMESHLKVRYVWDKKALKWNETVL